MPHMPASPFAVNGLADGQEDGERDAYRISRCPPLEPAGMDPAKSWSHRYQRGYEAGFGDAERHVCTAKCGK